MLVERLRINDVRNLASAHLDDMGLINTLVGPNGSGKTSVLESLHLLSTARSFRSHRVQNLIRWEQTHCVVWGQLRAGQGEGAARGHSIGVERGRDGTCSIRVDNRSVDTVAELTHYLPLQLINAETFRLLEGGPAGRRRYLDWGVFHVEPAFHRVWQAAQRCLRQRNALLRHGKITRSLLDPWSVEFADCGEQIADWRQSYVDRLQPVFAEFLAELTDLSGVELRYYRGWDKHASLAEVLERNLQGDCEQGTTRSGPQRADLKVTMAGQPAGEILSRGQIKLVVCALRLAQGRLLRETVDKRCVFLVDDLPAELDATHRRRLCHLLEQLGQQVVITCVSEDELAGCWSTSDRRVFHVEHGDVKVA